MFDPDLSRRYTKVGWYTMSTMSTMSNVQRYGGWIIGLRLWLDCGWAWITAFLKGLEPSPHRWTSTQQKAPKGVCVCIYKYIYEPTSVCVCLQIFFERNMPTCTHPWRLNDLYIWSIHHKPHLWKVWKCWSAFQADDGGPKCAKSPGFRIIMQKICNLSACMYMCMYIYMYMCMYI